MSGRHFLSGGECEIYGQIIIFALNIFIVHRQYPTMFFLFHIDITLFICFDIVNY